MTPLRTIQLSERDIEDEYNISVRTLQGWRTRKKGPPYRKVGGTLVRYNRAEFEAWLEASPQFLVLPGTNQQNLRKPPARTIGKTRKGAGRAGVEGRQS